MKILFMNFINHLILIVCVSALVHGTAGAQVRAITIPDEAERNHQRTFYSYDDARRKTEILEQRWLETGAWANQRRYIYSYESDERTLIAIMQFWENGTWNTATRETETFGSKNNLTSRTRDRWLNDTTWIPEQRDIYTYNEADQRTEWRSQLRDDAGNWYYNWRFTFTYDEDGNITEKTLQEWNRNRWELVRRITNRYTDDNKISDKIIYEPRRRTLVENTAYRYEYHEETGLLINLTKQRWNGSSWQNITAEEYDYDDDGRMTRTEYFDNTMLIARDIYIYDDEENTTQRIREQRQRDGRLRETWQYTYTYDFRGYKSSKSFLEYSAGAWVERYRTNYSYDIYGNRTSSVTQR